MIPLDEEALRQAVGPSAFERGLEYVHKGRVLEAHLEPGGGIRGSVKGSEWKPYEQRIQLDGNDVDGRCTCPVGENCKHVAAVLLDLLGRDEVVEVPAAKVDSAVASWLGSVEDAFADPNVYPEDVPQRVIYVLSNDAKGFLVELKTARLLKAGGYGKTTRLSLNPLYSKSWPKHVLPIDARLAEALSRSLGRTGYDSTFRLTGADGARLLPEILATGRCVWEEVGAPPLQLGSPHKATLGWHRLDNGAQRLSLDLDGTLVVGTAPPFYFDPEAGTLGELDLGLPATLVSALTAAPEIRPEAALGVREALARLVPDRPELLPDAMPIEYRQVRPIPILKIELLPCRHVGYGAWRKPAVAGELLLPIARISFDYEGIEVRQGATGEELRTREEDTVVIVPRRPRLEARAATALLDAGWTPGRQSYVWRLPKGHGEDYALLPESENRPEGYRPALYRFLRKDVPTLREAGWRIEVDEEFEIVEPTDWRIEVEEGGEDWFDLDLGVIVEGERVPLLPILLEALATLKGARLDDVRDDEEIVVSDPKGRLLVLTGARLRPLLRTLGEIFGRPGDWPEELRVPRAAAAELALLDESGLEWQEPERLRELRERLASFENPQSVAPPPSLRGDLRPYQLSGLSWLQFLREYGFGGILADDMGLGKTVQTLAHVLTEKEAGRLDLPALIVAPTSTLPNWRAEAERFAPDLRTLVLRGPDRKASLARILENDLVITSYPLLSRDREDLKEFGFHMVVLDEAQNIKNPVAAVTKAAKGLSTRHRICLSGTPVENRLEELWSLFDFAMPGFLGSLTRFRKDFKTPIENQDDAEASRRLARRIRPFVLRRTKDLVATELPDKTIVVERVELQGAQRDLYESLRLAMDRRVRELVAAKGLDRSRIEMLDALLKLRQACCDPRLVKLQVARKVKVSAKMDRLMELLKEMLAEGRRVLLFSQFTSMLDLIEEELDASEIARVRLDGSTEDRGTPVRRFQAGEVPLFLISLRAGGTGLNLTAADTVIHYDPWWNPAVEAQATDRAHRIGQTKAVLVVKLVAEGTVEEKILELQERKSKLADSVLSGDFEQSLTGDELRSILGEP